MSLSLKRYQESPKNQSAFFIQNRNTTSKQKITVLNTSASLPKNPEIDVKLPFLSRSNMRKSFSTFESDRNTKFKLQTFEEKLQQLRLNILNTRRQTKQTKQFTQFLKQSLIDKQLTNITKDMKNKIQGLSSFVKTTIIQNQQSSKNLRDDCNKLWDSSQELKECVFKLRMRVEAIQRDMGFQQ